MSRSRVLLLAAIAGGILYLAGALALGSPPTAADAPGDVVAWFREHQDAARFYAWTASFGTLAFAIFGGMVAALLPSPSREVFLIGVAALVVETAVQAWIWAGLALHPQSLDPATARTLLDVALFWGPILTGATTAMIGAVTVLGFGRAPLIPRWLTVLGVAVFAEQAIETVTVFGTDGFFEPGGAMNVVLGAGLTFVWLVGLVVWAVRDGGRAVAAHA